MEKDNLFCAIKMMLLAVILAEAATLKMMILPEGCLQLIHITALFKTYVEHLILSILFIGLGALIFLTKA